MRAHTTVDFVGSVAAVMLMVASKPHRNARPFRRLARELGGQTTARGALLFVAHVATVVVGVAHPRLRNAATADACEIVGRTRVVCC